MALGEHVAGLLNLSVFVSGTSLAALHLDRFELEPSPPPTVRWQAARELENDSELFRTLRALLDPTGAPIITWGGYLGRREYVLAYFAGIKAKFSLGGAFLLIFRYPLFAYFYTIPLTTITVLFCIYSLATFFIITSSTIWLIPWADNHTFASISYLSLTVIEIVMIMHFVGLYKLETAIPNLDKLLLEMNKYLEDLISFVHKFPKA